MENITISNFVCEPILEGCLIYSMANAILVGRNITVQNVSFKTEGTFTFSDTAEFNLSLIKFDSVENPKYGSFLNTPNSTVNITDAGLCGEG